MKRVKVACAIIQKGDKILVTQRSETMKMPLKWEFPGGKLEIGESEEECIIREIKEELNIEIELVKKLKTRIHSYPEFEIELIPFFCRFTTGSILLKEHLNYKWLTINEIARFDLAEADRPILNQLNFL